MARRTDGDETWNRLLNWTKGQKASERLAAQIIRSDNFQSIDPSHPLGGKDGLKDLIATKENLIWIVASYFPRGQHSFVDIQAKFKADLKGLDKTKADGLAFVTNQELTLKQRKELKEFGKPSTIEVYHLERIASILDSPANYGIRLEYLDIDLTKTEQLSYFASKELQLEVLAERLERLMVGYEQYKLAWDTDHSNYDIPSRSEEEVAKAIDEFIDRIWYERHQVLKYRLRKKQTTVDPEVWKGALKSAKAVEAKYGINTLAPTGAFEWGMLNGKLSALRWVLGEDWDMLDT